jgi:hypothetical protein
MQRITKNQQRKLGSLIITAILIGLIFVVLLPPSTAVLLTPGSLSGSNITLGSTITFQDVNLTIRGDERIPVAMLNFSIYENTSNDNVASVEFTVDGTETYEDPSGAFAITRTSYQSSWYQIGYGYGYDEPSGPGFNFSYGYGYGPTDLNAITISYDITFTTQESGSFYAKFSANCTSYTYTSSESSVFTVSGTNVNLTLATGWNLITVPVHASITAADLAENITGCEMISWFDAGNQTYKTHIAGVPAYDFSIRDGYGLFIYVNQSSYINVSGTNITNVTVPLSVGWDMIGWYNSTSTNSTNLAENVSGCQLVSWYNTTRSSFSSYTGSPASDFDIQRGKGIFVYVNQTSIWYGQG